MLGTFSFKINYNMQYNTIINTLQKHLRSCPGSNPIMSTMRGSALPITYAATSLIATQSRPSHSFQRPRHPARHTSPFAAQRVDVDCRQDGHLAPSTSRSKPATRAQAAHDHRTACDASDMRTHNQHPHPQRHRHVARSALAHGRPLAPSSKAIEGLDVDRPETSP